MKQPEARTLWGYEGNGPGKGLIHMVIDEKEPGMVTTWSETEKTVEGKGYSWYGPVAQFYKEFRQIQLK
jgi:hypothetical protein